MRLVRELLAADAEPALGSADARGRAGRYLDIVTSGLGLRAGAIVVREPAGGALACVAGTLSAAATALLADGDAGSALVRRSADERRAFLARRGTDEALVRALCEADPNVETVAVLPLADRGPAGVLVLAGDEQSLAADVVRTLNPALRLLALLVTTARDGAPADPLADRRAETMRTEMESQVRRILALEAQVSELEATLTAARALADAAVAAAAAAPGSSANPIAERPDAGATDPSPAVDPIASASVEEVTPTLVVVDASEEWARHPVSGHRVLAMAPDAETVPQLHGENPRRIVVNVAAPGGLAYVAAIRAYGIAAPVFGVLAQSGRDRVIGLDVVETVTRPVSSESLVAAVERAAPRGARVFAAGRDAETLMKMRQTLSKQGLSVSMARDAKQIDELVAMVRPQVVVIDLELPMQQGYELVLRMAATSPIPSLVLIAPTGDPSPVLQTLLRDRLSAGTGMRPAQWLAEIAAHKLATRVTARAAAHGAAAR